MSRSKTRELTGRHVLFILLAFFGVMLVVNIIFTVLAVKSFTGEDVPKSYRQGLEYNQAIESRREQAGLGWSVKANSYPIEDTATMVVVEIEDKSKTPLRGLRISGTARHPTDKAFDQNFEMTSDSDGLYRQQLNLSPGDWKLVMTAASGETSRYKFTHAIWVK